MLLFACSAFGELGGIDDFDLFLENLLRPTESGQDMALPNIEGFKPIINVGFDFGMPFHGAYTFATYDNWNLVLREDGTLFRARENLTHRTLVYDKIVFNQAGFYGVKTMFSDIVVAPQFNTITIRGKTIAATDAWGRTDIYYAGGRMHRHLQDVLLYSEHIILRSGLLYDLHLRRLTVGEYSVMSDIVNGFRIISCGFLFGFSYQEEAHITPQFSMVQHFNRAGYASVVTQQGNHVIIDTQGRVVLTQQEHKIPVSFDGVFIVFRDMYRGNMLGIADYTFRPLGDIRFLDFYNQSIYHGDIVVYNAPQHAQRFFSVGQNSFLLGEYERISVFKNHFLARDFSGLYTLYDFQLRRIASEVAHIAFNGRVLMISLHGRTYFFAIIEENW